MSIVSTVTITRWKWRPLVIVDLRLIRTVTANKLDPLFKAYGIESSRRWKKSPTEPGQLAEHAVFGPDFEALEQNALTGALLDGLNAAAANADGQITVET